MGTILVQDAPEIKPQGDADVKVEMPNPNSDPAADPLKGQEGNPPDNLQDAPLEDGRDQDPGVSWEQKYKVLQGKYNKEIPRLNKEIKRLKRENDDLLKRIEMLEYLIKQHQENKPQDAPQQDTTVEEDEEVKKLKEEFPEIYNALTKILSSKLGSVESQLSKFQREISQKTFYDRLSAEVPDWEELNRDPDFLDWLQETDPLTGLTRHQLMLIAYEKQDASSVARFFKSFKDMQQKQKTQNPPAASNVNPPSRRSTSSSSVAGTKKLWTESEVKNFYRSVAMGEIPPDEAKKIEGEITKAALENRIIYGK